MKKIEFHQVGMKNFGPFQDSLVYDFVNDTLSLIVGPNGVGKTMTLDAIPFTLYGITSKGARGDDVVNNAVGKNCHTWMSFSIDGDLYRVDRYHKYKKLGNTVILKKGSDTIAKGHRDVTPIIESLIMPRKLFMNTRMFGQKVKDFFTDLVDSERKEIFRMVLQLENYIKYYDSAKNMINDLDRDFMKINSDIGVQNGIKQTIEDNIKSQIERQKAFEEQKQEKLNETKEQININTRLLKNWKNAVEKLKKETENRDSIAEELSQVLNDLKQHDSKLNAKIEEIASKKQKKISDLKSDSDAKKMEISKDIRQKIDTREEKIEYKRKNLDEINKTYFENQTSHDKLIAECDANLKVYQNKVKEYENALNAEFSQCPTCFQDFSDKTHIQQAIEEEQGKIYEKNKKVKGFKKSKHDILGKIKHDQTLIHKEIEEMQKAIIQLRQQEVALLNENEQKLNELILKINKLESEMIAELEEEFKKLQVDLDTKKHDLEQQLYEIDKKIEELREAENNIIRIANTLENLQSRFKEIEQSEYDTSQLEEYQEKIKDINMAIAAMNAKIKELNQEKGRVLFWKQAFSSTGIPSMLIDDAIPFMNEQVSNYLERISNGRYLVSFDTLDETKSGTYRDKISVRMLDTQTRANSRVQFSGGQTRIVDIATILTLGDLQEEIQGVGFNLLLFDEIFDSLDDDNITYVSKVLRMLTKGKSIFIISHRHVDQLEADNVYQLS